MRKMENIPVHWEKPAVFPFFAVFPFLPKTPLSLIEQQLLALTCCLSATIVYLRLASVTTERKRFAHVTLRLQTIDLHA